ncbi:MAG: PD40 domain-containing protein, partial [Deltaproteobacteria bacterium]|nr:PD40 domain-containing protein [Deltaproteobacteria bacterium]
MPVAVVTLPNLPKRVVRLSRELERALRQSKRFTIKTHGLDRRQLLLEGQRIRPSNWRKHRVVLKLGLTQKGEAELLLFSPPKRRATWRMRQPYAREADAPRVARIFLDSLSRRLLGAHTYYASQIAFVRGRGKRSRVYVMNMLDGTPRPVSATNKESVLPAWSPRGGLAFSSYLWRNPDLFIIRDLAGRGRSYRISRHPGLNIGAAFSPKGNQLALTLSKDGNAEVYLLRTNGKVIRRLTHHRRIDTSPSFSPDGQEIAFVSERAGAPQLFVMPTAGGTPRQLTSRGSYNQEPAWCPTVACPWIAFTHRNDEGVYEITLVHRRKRTLRRVTRGRSP